MRKLRRYIERLLPVVAVLALASCSLDEIDEVKKPSDQGDRWGSLTIESLVINTDNESLDRGSNSTRTDGENGTASAGSETFKVPNPNNVTENTANYWIEVFDADGNVVDINGDDTGTGMTLENVNKLETTIKLIDGETEKKLKGIVLPPGQYTVWAYKDSTNDESIAYVAEDKKEDGQTTTPAYYMGNQTVEVVSAEDLGSDTSTPVAITCKLAQTLVTVEMSADMLKWFDETNCNNVKDGTPLQTIVTIAPENPLENVDYSYTFPYSSNHGVTDANGVVVDGGPFVYFKDHAGTTGSNTLSFKMEGVYMNVSVDKLADAWTNPSDPTGNQVTEKYKNNLTYVSMEREITNVTAAQWRQISFDIDHNTEGDVQFEVTISSYVFDKEIDVDVQTLFFGAPDKYQEETVPDIDPSAPVVTINTSDKSTNAVIAADLYDNSLVKWGANLEMTVTPNNGTTVTPTVIEVYADIESTNDDLMSALEAAGYTDGRVNFLSSGSTISEDVNYFTIDATNPSSKVTVTLSDPGMTALQNTYPGTHSITVWAKDSEERLNFTDLTIKSGGTTGGNIGSASGGSGGDGDYDTTTPPSIVGPTEDFFDKRHDLTLENKESFNCAANITSKNVDGFTEFDVVIHLPKLGEMVYGMFGGEYDAENEIVTFSLTDPDPSKVANIKQVGLLPDNLSSYKGEHTATFDVSPLMGTLYEAVEGDCEFTIRVKDANGTAEATISFNVIWETNVE